MGISTGAWIAISALTTAGVSTAVGANTAAHEATNAHTAQAEGEMQATDQVLDAQNQQQQSQTATANNTATAQARVRAISNPDGDTLMTSPLGSVGSVNGVRGGTNDQTPGAPNLKGPGPTPGQIVPQAKNTLGG